MSTMVNDFSPPSISFSSLAYATYARDEKEILGGLKSFTIVDMTFVAYLFKGSFSEKEYIPLKCCLVSSVRSGRRSEVRLERTLIPRFSFKCAGYCAAAVLVIALLYFSAACSS